MSIQDKWLLKKFHDDMNDHFKAVGYEGVEFHSPDYAERKKRNQERKKTRKKAIKQYKTVEELRNCLADEVQALEQAKAKKEQEIGVKVDDIKKESEKAEILEYIENYFPTLKQEILSRGRDMVKSQEVDEVQIR